MARIMHMTKLQRIGDNDDFSEEQINVLEKNTLNIIAKQKKKVSNVRLNHSQ